MDLDPRFSFIAEWYDTNASLARQYQLLYYTADGTIEMFDLKNHRHFLKRCAYPAVTEKDLYLGSVVTIYSRQLTIQDYADEKTRSYFDCRRERTLAMIKPNAYAAMGKIIDMILQNGIIINKMQMFKLSRRGAEAFYAEHAGKPFFDKLVDFMSSDAIVALELVGDNCIKRWRELIGPTDSNVARREAPNSIRAKFGIDNTQNAAHGSDAPDSAAREIGFFFGNNKLASTACFDHCTLGIVKPHAVKAGLTGKIIDTILEEGFEISALSMIQFDTANAEEFAEVYKGVVPEYRGMVEQLSSGPCVAMEIRSQDPVNSFRSLCGPADPEIARHLRPHTIRARFGDDKITNAVHCTDLENDGVLESEYIFRVLHEAS